MRLRVPCLALVLLLGTGAALHAASTWYAYYYDARDKYIPAKSWDQCLTALQEAIKLKPEPALNEQTYGLSFEDYFPYYVEGKCYLGKGEYSSAIRLFNIEEKKGKIQGRDGEYRTLRRLRAEAEAGQKGLDTADSVRKIKDGVDRYRREAVDLHKQGKLEEALAKLLQAQKLAEALNDPATQADIADRTQKIRDELKRTEDAQQRTKRIDKDLADGLKLLQDGKATEAKLRFESVLSLEPAHAGALEGKRRAEEEIQASTTREHRDALLREGRALFQAGRYKDALRPLAEAGADTPEAPDLLARAMKYVEGIQKEKDKRVRVDQLMTEAKKVLSARKFAVAVVRLDTVLELDPKNTEAQERLHFAEQGMSEEIFNHYFPNTPPVLTFFMPGGEGPLIRVETEGQRIDVAGVASDDRGLARIRFLQGGQVVSDQEVVDPRTEELPRTHKIERSFELAKGVNEIKVIAVDGLGATQEQTFLVTRTLQVWQQPWFIPSAAATSVGLIGLAYAAQRTRRRRAVRSRFNPYIAGAPVLEDDMFFGRQKLLARILNVLHHNSLMITGERRIGKTTLLHHLGKALEQDEGTEYQFVPVSTDLQGVPESGFFDAVMTDVVEQARPRAETLAGLRFRPGAEAYEGRDFSHDLQRVVEDLTARTPRKVKLVLLIDEVDVLNEYSERVNQRLRSIFMKNFSEHLVAIMSGVGIKRIWKSEGSPWYNFFDEIELTAFSREEAEALIRQPVEGVFRWAPEAVEAILEYSALKPYVIQKFCIHAVNHMLEEGRTTITAADVEAVRSGVLFERPEEVHVPETASA